MFLKSKILLHNKAPPKLSSPENYLFDYPNNGLYLKLKVHVSTKNHQCCFYINVSKQVDGINGPWYYNKIAI